MFEKSTKRWTILEEESGFKLVYDKQPQQTRRGREIFLLTLAVAAMIAIVFDLHANMADDWTLNRESRTRVMVLGLMLFIISILVCYYTINRLGVKPCNPHRSQGDLSTSNSNTSLLSYDLPPCYESIQLLPPPPSYHEINLWHGAAPTGARMLETAHDKATG